jgi:DNA-binding XRE family transcriptional regulator
MSKKIKKRFRYPEAFRRVVSQRIRTLVESYLDVTTVAQASEAIDVTPQSIYNWMNGACCPNLYNATQLAVFYDVPVDTIVGRLETTKLRKLVA